MAQKAEEEFHAVHIVIVEMGCTLLLILVQDRDRIRGRRGGGNKFVDDQLRLLIAMVKKLDKSMFT